MLETLARWNRWGTARLDSGTPRDITDRLRPFLDSRDILALAGPRWAGKTTVMYQVMDELERRGVSQEAMLHVNLEDPGFSPELGLDLLDRLYSAHLQEAFMVRLLPYYSLKVSERQRHPNKVHAVDLGLRNAVCLTGSPDRGRLAETVVHNALAAFHDDLHYFRKDTELDLLVRRGNQIEAVIQVTVEGLEREEVLRRELAPLEEAEGKFPGARRILVAGHLPKRGVEVPEGVEVVPLWRTLLGELEVALLDLEAADVDLAAPGKPPMKK